MSSSLHFSLIRDPKLIDVVDEEWEKDVKAGLPVDGAYVEVLKTLLFKT